MHGLSTTVNIAAVVLLVSLIRGNAGAGGKCEAVKGITSNDVVSLAGSGDTLWMLTDDNSGFYINYFEGNGNLALRDTVDKNWNGYSFGCKQLGILSVAFGEGRGIVCFDTSAENTDEDGANKANLIWSYDYGSKNISEITFPWKDKALSNAKFRLTAQTAVNYHGSSYFACLDGGLVKWDHKNNSYRVYTPDSLRSTDLKSFIPGSDKDSSRRVEDVKSAGSSLVVTTPSKIWIYSPGDSSWDDTVRSVIADNGYKLKKFISAFADTLSKGSPLYCFAMVNSTDTSLLKYNRKENSWRLLLRKAPQSMTFANNGYIYMVFDGKMIQAYRDTLGDSAAPQGWKESVGQDQFQTRIMKADTTIEYPEFICDILYVSKSDSSGYLWIATSEGLFISDNEIPGKSDSPFILISRAPKVKGGLKQTYASPGIINYRNEKAIFVYNLSKDAKVTVKVYDYNMDLVKTVISGEPRKAGDKGGPQGRSTEKNKDWWDGRNESGRTVAPGVYYYKITTDNGERAFGKLVVAK